MNEIVIQGPLGHAWRFDRKPKTKAHKAGLAGWILVAPFAHPAWSQYMFSLIHLRPIKGTQEVVFDFPGATHQLFVYALNPEHNITLETDPEDTIHFLQPINQKVMQE